MATKNRDLHGNAPDKCATALLLIDVINDLDFPQSDQILPRAIRMARAIASLKHVARKAGAPTIYANDNFGRWRSDFNTLIEHCLEPDCRGRPIVDVLKPDADDYFILKPKHSAFFNTGLDILLEYLEVETLVMAGIAANICVLFSANDAYMRDFNLFVPRDCVVANTERETEYALLQMQQILKADTRISTELSWPELMNSVVSGAAKEH